MKKSLLRLFFVAGMSVMMTSCYTYTATIGKGPQTGIKVVAHNHYLVNGLAPIATVNIKDYVGDAKDYSITISQTFIDGVVSSFTSGLYTPTTVTITK